jgi:amino acid transporter
VLRRTLGFWLLLLYGIGIIVGAGIYVLVGTVTAQAGMTAPLAFVAAGALATLTGLTYAELVTRLPEASGAVAYVHAASGSRSAAWAVALAVVLIAVTSAATVARGSAGYVHQFVAAPDWLPGAVLVAVFTAAACLKVEFGARLAALFGVLEVGGLLFAAAIPIGALADLPERASELLPHAPGDWRGLAGGAFLAFFAFMGFETLANMAEETRDVARTLPRAILAAIAVTAVLYALVALVAVLAVPLDILLRSRAPLCLLLEQGGIDCGRGFAAIALAALSNGILVELILVGRLLYGMARRGLVPAWFGGVAAGSGVPVRATVMGGGAVMLLAAAVPFEALAGATSGLTLAVFTAVNLALAVLKWRDRRGAPPAAPPAVNVPLAVPALGAIASLGLLVAALWP